MSTKVTYLTFNQWHTDSQQHFTLNRYFTSHFYVEHHCLVVAQELWSLVKSLVSSWHIRHLGTQPDKMNFLKRSCDNTWLVIAHFLFLKLSQKRFVYFWMGSQSWHPVQSLALTFHFDLFSYLPSIWSQQKNKKHCDPNPDTHLQTPSGKLLQPLSSFFTAGYRNPFITARHLVMKDSE